MEFSKEDLRQIVYKALTLDEIVKNDAITQKNQPYDSVINSKLKYWCNLISDGNWQEFEKRFAWDGLNINQINYYLDFVRTNNQNYDYQIPPWAKTLNECLKAINYDNHTAEENRFLDSKEHLPFEEVFLSFIYVARKKVIIKTGIHYELLTDNAHASLERSLLEWLVNLCALSMVLELSNFQTSREPTILHYLKKPGSSRLYYQKFTTLLLEGELLTFFQEYPVLARLVGISIDLWVDATTELITRFADDLSEIQRTFQSDTKLGQIIDIVPYLSDRHHNGRTVTLIRFRSGLKLIYKPKDIGIEEAYVKLLEWLNNNGIPLELKLFKILNRSTYGWVEFVEEFTCKNQEEFSRYYKRFGMLVCLSYILDSTDLHIGNIRSCGEHPVIIDLETLMQPRVRELEDIKSTGSARDIAYEHLWNSTLRTGLLPQWFVGRRKQVYDVSGIGGVPEKISYTEIKFPNIHKSRKLIGLSNHKVPAKDNTVLTKKTEILLEKHHGDILTGFQQMYEFLAEKYQVLLEHDSPLRSLASQKIRFVFRHTQTYTFILQRTLNPKFLRDGVQRSIEIDILSKSLIFESDVKPLSWQLLKLEKLALEQMDIPLLTTYPNSNALILDSNQKLSDYFIEPSFDGVITHLKALNYNELEQQLNLIEGALYTRIADSVHSVSLSDNSAFIPDNIASLTQSDMLEQAVSIGLDIKKRAICSTDGSATWIAPQYVLSAKRFQLLPLDYSLYDGNCGIALYLAALAKITKNIEFRDLALGAIQSFRRDLQELHFTQNVEEIGIGGAVGLGSIIYAFVQISQFLQDSNLLDDTRKIISLMSSHLVSADQNFDIISGASGAILGLIALYNTSNESAALNLALICGEHLLNNRITSDSGYKTWKTLEGKLQTGFSHGATGIAYALLRLYQISGEKDFLEAAIQAFNYERSAFNLEAGNWPYFKETREPSKNIFFNCSWCHGAPGIGLARVGVLDILDTDMLRQDINIAIETTKKYKFSDVDHLCCGNLARVEFLFTAAHKLSQPDLLEIPMRLAAQVVSRAKQRGNFSYGRHCLAYHPGFFQGAAGIGYELLRLAYPDQLPSVLLWE